MSDAKKLELARAIHGTPHATRDSFSPSTWAGVERAWAWVEKHYQPKEPTVKQEIRCTCNPQRTDEDGFGPFARGPQHADWCGANQRATLAKMQTNEPPAPPWTAAQREAAEADFKKREAWLWATPAPSPAPAGVPDRDALANAMQLALAKSPNDVVAPLRECRLDVVDLRYRQADAALEMFAPALRTRDERIAEQAATIATITKERDEARESLERAYYDACGYLAWACSMTIDSRRASVPTGGMTRSVHELAQRAEECRSREETAIKERDAALARVAELEKRGAVDVDACADAVLNAIKTHVKGCGDTTCARADVEKLIRLHTRDVRRITREEARLVYQLLPRTTWDGLLKALRAIGFEVEA